MGVQDLLDRLRGEDLFEMSNILPRTTGLPFVLWVSKGHRARHGPRVKAYAGPGRNRRDEIVVTIASDPAVERVPRKGRVAEADLARLVAYVRDHREALLRYWQDDAWGIEDLLDALREGKQA